MNSIVQHPTPSSEEEEDTTAAGASSSFFGAKKDDDDDDDDNNGGRMDGADSLFILLAFAGDAVKAKYNGPRRGYVNQAGIMIPTSLLFYFCWERSKASIFNMFGRVEGVESESSPEEVESVIDAVRTIT